MSTQNEATPQQTSLNGATILAIMSVALAAGWIAFAYYKSGSAEADGNGMLLLHPIVPILLTVLLIKVYRWVDIKFIVNLEIAMMVLWVFIRLLGVLMPFILGFGFAYLFRFLMNVLPFPKQYQRVIATLVIILACIGLFFYTGKQISNQAKQMTAGLQKFYYKTIQPYVFGEKLKAIAISVEGETETLYRTQGLYLLKGNEPLVSKTSIPTNQLTDRPIQAIAVGENYIYAGTQSGLYRRDKNSDDGPWKKVENTSLEDRSVQAINIPSWDRTHIYVGTSEGLFKSEDSAANWSELEPTIFGELSIISVISIEGRNREIAPMDENSKYIYVASRPASDQNAQTTGAIVYRHLQNSARDWEQLSMSNLPYLHTLVSGDRKPAELYAGTMKGIYHCNTLPEWQETENTEKHATPTLEWQQTAGTEALSTPISLLITTPSGVYAGNEKQLWYRPTDASVPEANAADETEPDEQNVNAWKNYFRIEADGILDTYKDNTIVMQAKSYLTEKIPTLAQKTGPIFNFAGSLASQLGGFLATVFLGLIVFVYASQSFENYFRSFTDLVPEKHRESVKAYLREIDKNMQQFLKGQATVIAIVSVISCAAYGLIGVPFALLIGLLAGFCNAIPTFGPFIGGGFAFFAMLMGLAAGDFSISEFLIRCAFVLGAIFGIQAIDNSLISPKVMSSAVDVDPLLIMFAVIVGAAILGFWGVLLAIPIIVVIKSVIAISQAAEEETAVPALEEQ